jgi:hypothetical protein
MKSVIRNPKSEKGLEFCLQAANIENRVNAELQTAMTLDVRAWDFGLRTFRS